MNPKISVSETVHDLKRSNPSGVTEYIIITLCYNTLCPPDNFFRKLHISNTIL
jgi:hypothetical protein